MQRPRMHSPASQARIEVKNRRIRYLGLHPEYFENPSLELAGQPIWQQLSQPR